MQEKNLRLSPLEIDHTIKRPAPEVTEVGNCVSTYGPREDLKKYAEIASTAHKQVQHFTAIQEQAGQKSIQAAIEAGEALVSAKEMVGHGQWLNWLAENCKAISEDTAERYMRLAKPNSAGVRKLSKCKNLTQAYRATAPARKKEDADTNGAKKPTELSLAKKYSTKLCDLLKQTADQDRMMTEIQNLVLWITNYIDTKEKRKGKGVGCEKHTGMNSQENNGGGGIQVPLPVIDLNKPISDTPTIPSLGDTKSVTINGVEPNSSQPDESLMAAITSEEHFSVKPEFWIHRELAKVKDPKRRSFLAGMFEGRKGYLRFLALMKTRKGAFEFKNGLWASKLPKYRQKDLDKLKRPCSICGESTMPKFTPWGEIFTDFTPICPKHGIPAKDGIPAKAA